LNSSAPIEVIENIKSRSIELVTQAGAAAAVSRVDEVELKKLSPGWPNSVSRDLPLSHIVLDSIISSYKLNLEKAGIFGALLQGPVNEGDFQHQRASVTTSGLEQYRSQWPPKKHFFQMSSAKLAMLLGRFNFTGPAACYSDPVSGWQDAYESASLAVLAGRCEFAIVLSAFSTEDSSMNQIYSTKGAMRLIESSVAALITLEEAANYRNINWEIADMGFEHGICSPYFLKRLASE
jgi:hypothetical protein